MQHLGTIFNTTRIICLSFCATIAFSNQAISCPCSEIKVPESGPEFAVAEGLSYMKTPEYRKEFSRAISSAYQACRKHKGEDNLAIVSDIDETVLSNKEYFENNQNWDNWDNWESKSSAPVLKPTAEFLAWARKNGFVIFFITGRREKDRAVTIKNLAKAGIAYDGLYLRGDNDDSPAQTMKVAYRKQIEKMGFKIIVSIGDQYSDLAGGHAEDCEKLPNKIYFIK